MSAFQDQQQFVTIMDRLMARLRAIPGATDDLVSSGLTIRLRCRNPEAIVTIFSEGDTLLIVPGEEERRADLELELEADLLHRVWMDEVRLRDALFRGDIHIVGSPFRVFHLAELFRVAEEVYPEVYFSVLGHKTTA